MNEALRNVAVLVYALCAINSNANAQAKGVTIGEEASQASAPVIVYGASAKAPGEKDEIVLEQASGNDNPLGNPIVADCDSLGSEQNYIVIPGGHQISAKQAMLKQASPQNPPLNAANSPQKVNNEIQNTLYESGGRIYDLQSYPDKDIKTIEQPNISKAITNYPAD